ncbi:hypothetical protein V6N11_033214 [Hibiscus sabdariffa]|uniref:Uncharacterized protein n=1 Tax=Hibiscus sabdariffa TaxID=183260 RepID=A0ABR2PXD3_9ROSI
MYILRHVTFNEHIFPFNSPSATTSRVLDHQLSSQVPTSAPLYRAASDEPSTSTSVEPLGPSSDAIACNDAFPTFAQQHDEPTCEPVAAQHDAEHDDSEHDDTHNEHDAQYVDCDPVTHADTHSNDVLPECDADHDDSNPITHTGALPAPMELGI